MKRTQQWKQDQGTFYAINKQRRLTYRRVDGGAWEPVEPLTKAALAETEQVGWDRIDGGWFAVHRSRA